MSFRKLRCPSCGANILKDKQKCAYCGTSLERVVDEESKKSISSLGKDLDTVQHFVSSMGSRQKNTSHTLMSLMMGIPFTIIWIVMTAFGAVSVGRIFGIGAIMPLLFCLFGVVALICEIVVLIKTILKRKNEDKDK